MQIQSLRGMHDIGEPEIHIWQHVESLARQVSSLSGFHEVRTPILEPTALFKRGVGETTDIVEKEMYTFEDRNGDSLSLRPEGTASIVRSVAQHQWHRSVSTLKMYYLGPMFRHERPQKGRLRQFYQFGLEIVGVAAPWADVEVMSTQHQFFQKLGLSENIELHISSLGDEKCRPAYKELLLKTLRPLAPQLCSDCQRRMEKNPLRVLDCKVESCRKVAATLPVMMDHLCEDCDQHFQQVRQGLEALKIPYQIDPKIVRGLDYYTRTSFEFITSKVGSQGTLCGGGRYDRLFEDLSGDAVPGIGCAMGLDRIMIMLEDRIENYKPKTFAFILCPNPTTRLKALEVLKEFRDSGFRAEMELSDRSFKAQMKQADKMGARWCVILGDDELNRKAATVKNMETGQQQEISLEQLIKTLASSN